jgi:CubicO group peptidase (beta-lactamase class C family)
MAEPMPRTRNVLEAGMRSKLHVGVQLFVVFNGSSACDLTVGVCAPGRPMTSDSMMTWLSCSKIATSILFARIWEEGLVDLDDPVRAHLPEFKGGGKDAITIRQV